MARERATDTRALVAAAARVFEEKGYHNSTIDDIAAAAGISRPTVYKYTKSKQHLLDLMVEEVTSDMARRTDAILTSDGPASERLRDFVSTHVHATIANRAFYAIVFSEEVELSNKMREFFRAWAREQTRRTASLVKDCLDDAGTTGIDPTVGANLLESMLATLYRWYHSDGAVSPESLINQILAFLGSLIREDGLASMPSS